MPPTPTEDVRRRDVLAVHVVAALVVVLASTVLLGWSTGPRDSPTSPLASTR